MSFFFIKKPIILFELFGIFFVLLFAKNIPIAFSQVDTCGDGIVSGSEVCDKKGDVGCFAPTPACNTDCGGCIACTIKSKLSFFGKPVICIIQDAIKWILSVVGGIVFLMLIIGGAYYMFSGENPKRQESAKKMITYAIMGIVLILISYALLALIDKIFVRS